LVIREIRDKIKSCILYCEVRNKINLEIKAIMKKREESSESEEIVDAY